MAGTQKLSLAFCHEPPPVIHWAAYTYDGIPLVVGFAGDGALCRVGFCRGRSPAAVVKGWRQDWPETQWVEDASLAARAKKIFSHQLDATLLMTGTAFQHAVWKQMVRIAPGQAISYGELARRIGKPKAARAVGAACGANPVAILVPCHRVVASDGSLGGFAGGLVIKKELLHAEAA